MNKHIIIKSSLRHLLIFCPFNNIRQGERLPCFAPRLLETLMVVNDPVEKDSTET